MSGNLNNDFNQGNLNTGDILLFRSRNYGIMDTGYNDNNRSYDNAMIIIKNPWFFNKEFKGLYVISENEKGGIEIITLTSVICNHLWIDVRSWSGIDYNEQFNKKIELFLKEADKSHYCLSDYKSMHLCLYDLGFRCCLKKHRYNHTLTLKLTANAWNFLNLLPDRNDISHWTANEFAKVYIDKPYILSKPWRLK